MLDELTDESGAVDAARAGGMSKGKQLNAFVAALGKESERRQSALFECVVVPRRRDGRGAGARAGRAAAAAPIRRTSPRARGDRRPRTRMPTRRYCRGGVAPSSVGARWG